MLLATPLLGFCDPFDEALMAVAHSDGITVYTTCIVTPPTDPIKEAACLVLYNKFQASLQAVNAPFPIVPSLTPSPYAWSPYDICRYETSHFVFNITLGFPVCPAL